LGCCGGNEVRVCSGLKHQKGKRNVDHFAGLVVSVKETSICIVDDTGRIVREVKMASEPEALLEVLAKARLSDQGQTPRSKREGPSEPSREG
jgi:hypothetical protein